MSFDACVLPRGHLSFITDFTMKFTFLSNSNPQEVTSDDWNSWQWQMRRGLKTLADFESVFKLEPEELRAFNDGKEIFNIRTTPYYAKLGAKSHAIRKIMVPHISEMTAGVQALFDPLGERKNNPTSRVIHRYSDRVLFLVTDTCSVYCRFCTRKHFTGQEQAFIRGPEYENALEYIRNHPGIREVILSGGDPLTLSDTLLEKVLSDLRQLDHVEIIRIGSRMPVVCPMRITDELVSIFKRNKPVYLMSHFNHPDELTAEAVAGLEKLVDNGVPVMNQMVLLNGINNHPAIVQALSRRLLYLRVKPYYMFQCDPSEGTDHLRTSVEDSLEIQKELWGHLSGLAMPNLSLDIPDGGGKAYLVPNFQVAQEGLVRKFIGWDGVPAEYISPAPEKILKPDPGAYQAEWDLLKKAKQNSIE